MKLLILQELEAQPDSYLEKITKSFEMTSIQIVTKKDEVRSFKTRPAFSSTLVLIFKSFELFKNNQNSIRFEWMWPILVCRTASATASAKAFCIEKEIPYQISVHTFDKEAAKAMIHDLAKKPVSNSFVDMVISQVGLSPSRILSAMSICDAVGYTAKNVTRYVDKYRYVSIHDVVKALLGVARVRQRARAMLQVEQSIYWFKNFKKQIMTELKTILEVYQDALAGETSEQHLLAYLDAKGLTRYEVMFCLDLFNQVSIVEISLLKERVSICRNALELLTIMQ